ncbi:MAG: chorismate synthase [Elusimicrobia bacterium]|nr:chorismate synthase [Elusimicrobiota bacterium]
MIRYYTAGESHGRSVTVILEGIPAGLRIDREYINVRLGRRQEGYGRGERMKIEKDAVEISSGIRWGETIGSPICMTINNRDWENWKDVVMSLDAKAREEDLYITRSRPGHADLAGVLKYNRNDARDILERSSARETAARVAAGAVAERLLEEFGSKLTSYTSQIGKVKAPAEGMDLAAIKKAVEGSRLRCVDVELERKMMDEITRAGKEGDTVGGVFTVIAEGVPVGLGSHTQWDLKIDGNIARAVMSIQAVKGVEFGRGFALASLRGSVVHDEIKYDGSEKKFYRASNNAGGVEGGMTNGEPLVVNAVMKPISSLKKPLRSIDIKTKKEITAEIIRSDVCAVPAAGVVGEAVIAIELARAFREKFGGDSLGEMKRNFDGYLKQVREY